jgi:outer membrane protein TolC
MTRVGWMQEVPNGAKRKARTEAAHALTRREQPLLMAERQAVRRDTTLAWLERWFAEQRLTLFTGLERENKVLQDTIRARVAAGRALPADATMARLEAVELADRRDELSRDLATSGAALQRWVGDAAGAALAGPAPSLDIDPARIRERLGHHAELAAYQPMADMAAAEAREAEAARKGDWGWEVSYGKRGSAYSDMLSFQVSIELWKLPGLGIGVSPLLQWLLLPPLVAWLTARHARYH